MTHPQLPHDENGDIVGNRNSIKASTPTWQILTSGGAIILVIFGIITFVGNFATKSDMATLQQSDALIRTELQRRAEIQDRNSAFIEDLQKRVIYMETEHREYWRKFGIDETELAVQHNEIESIKQQLKVGIRQR